MSLPNFCPRNSDCERALESIIMYDVKIVFNLIVQLYYFVEDNGKHSSIQERDRWLQDQAMLFGGKFTGEQGLIGRLARRDIDFEFQTPLSAHSFLEHIRANTKFQVYRHENHINTMGILKEKPTIIDLFARHMQLVNSHCT